MTEPLKITIEATKLASWLEELWGRGVNEPHISAFADPIEARNDALKRFQTACVYIAKDIARACLPDADDMAIYDVLNYLAGESDLDSDEET